MAKVLACGVETRQHFTGYERDAESGLDYAHARYFSSSQGRFASVDPYGKSANVLNPQSFNRYSYVLNNPVNATDPTGMMTQVSASASWGDVSGNFWGEDFGFGGPHPMNGSAIIENGMNGFAERTTVSYCLGGDCGGSSGSENVTVTVSPWTGLDIPTDPNDRAMFDTLLGEASWVGNRSWDMDEYGEGAYSNPRHPNRKLGAWEVEGEMKYMIYTVDNRLHDWTQYHYTGWKDVIERAPKQFKGYKNGDNIKNLGSDPASVERAQMAIQAIKDYHASPLRNSPQLERFYYWKSIIQDNNNNGRPGIMIRGRATRMANTDFMVSERRY